MNSSSDSPRSASARKAAPRAASLPSQRRLASRRKKALPEFARLLEIMARLRRPGTGCPWDLEQTLHSLKTYLVEEAFEALDAMESGNPADMAEELGDLLLQIVFIAQIAAEQNLFDMVDVSKGISDKLVYRHPHIFGTAHCANSEEVLRNWDALKRKEKKSRKSALDGVPAHVPPLHRAYQLQKRAARTGFDWPSLQGALDKFAEESAELREAIAEGQRPHILEELGDTFFALVKVARFLECDPHYALSKTNAKFEARFRAMEAELLARGRPLKSCSLDEMCAVWNQFRPSCRAPAKAKPAKAAPAKRKPAKRNSRKPE